MRRQAENRTQKHRLTEDEIDKQTLELEKLRKDNKRLESDLESQRTKNVLKNAELQNREKEMEKQRRELEAKELALNQNADIQKLNQRLMLNRQEMKDRLLTDIKKSNSVLDFLNKDHVDQEMYMNQSMANLE